MVDNAVRTILCLSSYFKGNRFLQRCKREGCRVYLLTVVERRDAPWRVTTSTMFFSCRPLPTSAA